MNVEKNFFLQGVTSVAKTTMRNTVGSNSVPIRIFWLGILIFVLIGMVFGLWWLAQKCTGYNAMYFEHFEDASGTPTVAVAAPTVAPVAAPAHEYTYNDFLQNTVLKNINDTKIALSNANDSLDNALDDLGNSKENVCGVMEDIQSNFVQSRMAGIDPTLAKEPKEQQTKKLASRQARAQKDWARRKKVWMERHHATLVECFANSEGSTLAQITTTCDDIEDILTNLKEQIQSAEVRDVINLYFSIGSSVDFATPLLLNRAVVVSNNVSTIRDMPKPEVTPTDVSGAVKEGFEGKKEDREKFMLQFINQSPSIYKKYKDSSERANNMIRDIGGFFEGLKILQKRTVDMKDINAKMKTANQNLKDGKITPSYMDEKPK